MLRLVIFDIESVLLQAPSDDAALDLVQRCYSRYRLGGVSVSDDGNVALKARLDATAWGRHLDVVVTPMEVSGPGAFRAVCSAMGTQVTSAAAVTARRGAADDAARAGLAVVFVGPEGPDGAHVVEHIDWVPEALTRISSSAAG